jgi:hypothetical protein
MRRERSRLKNLTREGRITAKDYTLFSMETKEMENGNTGGKVSRFPFVELKH